MTASVFADAHGAGNVAAPVDTNSTASSAISLKTAITHLVTAGAETRTLAAGVEGQIKVLYFKTDGGDCVVTLTGNPAASDVVTLNDAGDTVVLLYVNDRWIVVVNSGATVA